METATAQEIVDALRAGREVWNIADSSDCHIGSFAEIREVLDADGCDKALVEIERMIGECDKCGAAGIIVDTHDGGVSCGLYLVRVADPGEKQLMANGTSGALICDDCAE